MTNHIDRQLDEMRRAGYSEKLISICRFMYRFTGNPLHVKPGGKPDKFIRVIYAPFLRIPFGVVSRRQYENEEYSWVYMAGFFLFWGLVVALVISIGLFIGYLRARP